MLHQPAPIGSENIIPHLLDLCNETGYCNAFVLAHTKESIRQMFLDELRDINIKAKKYPDILALEWVLDQTPMPVHPWINFIQKFFKREKCYEPDKTGTK
jgi:hypothetical protein